MERAALERDWLYNNSLTAFVGALLMLLARYLSDSDIDRDVGASSIQWTHSVVDSISPHLNFLHLPLSAILFVLAFTLFVASTFRTSPFWALRTARWFSPLAPIFVWVGLFTAWLPLSGDLFTSEPHLGAVTFYVGFLFLVLMSVRPLIVMRLMSSDKVAEAGETDVSIKTKRRIRDRLHERWRSFMFPYGKKRTVNPLKWRPLERVIISTQGIAVITVIISLAAQSASVWPSWVPFSPQILALISASLTSLIVMGVLWHTVSAGDLPLTNRRGHYVRQVVQAMELEKEGAEMDWENIDSRGGIPFKKVPPNWR